jgi:hypothetical protein
MTRRFLLTSALLLACLPLAAQIPLPHHVLFVDGVNGNDNNNCKTRKTACKTIGHAISLASPDDAILVAPATYDENLTINFNLGIIGSGASTTIIDGGQQDSVVFVPNSNSHVVLAELTIQNGKCIDGNGGGGIDNFGTLEVRDVVITHNTVTGPNNGYAFGGGIFSQGTVTLNHTVVSNNQSSDAYFGSGSGIANLGTLTINDSTISGNFSETTDTNGAGISSGPTTIINRSTISGNRTGGGDDEGGGIESAGLLIMNNSTVYGNKSVGGVGGGIVNDSGTVMISSSTISGNEAQYGGGGISNGATVNIQNSIVSDNTGGNCDGTFTSLGYNLSSDSTCNFSGPGDLNNTEPKLGPLQNNGGPTQTMSEALSSPTVDAGNPSGCTDGQGHLLTTDQRGAPRPGKNKHDKRCDMGAFERQTD